MRTVWESNGSRSIRRLPGRWRQSGFCFGKPEQEASSRSRRRGDECFKAGASAKCRKRIARVYTRALPENVRGRKVSDVFFIRRPGTVEISRTAVLRQQPPNLVDRMKTGRLLAEPACRFGAWAFCFIQGLRSVMMKTFPVLSISSLVSVDGSPSTRSCISSSLR